jgi:hypothetical protein
MKLVETGASTIPLTLSEPGAWTTTCGKARAPERWLRPCRLAALAQAGALLINHIAPGNRTLAPSA